MRAARRFRLAGWGLVLAFALSPAPTAAADPVPPGYAWSEHYFRSKDGTRLHADVFTPQDLGRRERTPVALVVSPYFGTSSTNEGSGIPPDPTARGPRLPVYYRDITRRLLDRRYTLVQVTLRGFGASEGCNDFGGRGEQADAEAAVEWAARRRWSNGRVGTFGISYDGYTQVMNLANRPKGLVAAVIMAPVISGYRAMYMNRNLYFPFGPQLPFFYEYLALLPPSLQSDPEQWAHAAAGTLQRPGCPLDKLPQSDPDPRSDYWRERDLVARARRSRVPVLWAHGFLDANAKPDNFLPVWGRLRGPKRAWLGQFDHWPPGGPGRGGAEFTGRDGFADQAADWLDAYVARDRRALRRVRRQVRVEVQRGDGRWRAESSWPPRDARPVALRVAPGSYQDQPGNDGETRAGCLESEYRCYPPFRRGVGTWTFTRPLRHAAHLAGAPRLAVRVVSQAPDVNLVALLYDISPVNRATLISRGAFVVPRSGRYSFRLYPQDWRLRRGHRVGLLISGADDWWFSPGMTYTTVRVTGGRLKLPFLGCRRRRALDGGPSQAMARRGPFEVPAASVAAGTVRGGLPTAMRNCGR